MKKFRYIITIGLLLVLLSGLPGCVLYLPLLPSPSETPTPSSPPPDSTAESNEYLDPSWTLPRNDEDLSPLPDIASVVNKVRPSVVAVTTKKTVTDIFQRQYTESGAGSGVIIDAEGHIITNNHVITGTDEVQVQLSDGRFITANVVGADPLTDLAVLKIEIDDVPFAKLGNSSQLIVGEWAIAIGNALGEGISATEGIISRLNVEVNTQGNTLTDLIQTTAAINPGNSGGPLLNMAGEVIGITSIKLASVNVESMGYAISSNSAEPVITSLIQQGYVSRAWMGVALYTVNAYVAAQYNLAVETGAYVGLVVENSPAAKAGIEEGDVIINFDDQEINTTQDLFEAITNSKIGQRVQVTYIRGEDPTEQIVWVELAESPSPWE